MNRKNKILLLQQKQKNAQNEYKSTTLNDKKNFPTVSEREKTEIIEALIALEAGEILKNICSRLKNSNETVEIWRC